MADDEVLIPTPRPVRMGADGSPWPLCPCGEYQAAAPGGWQGWRTCPCGGGAGQVTSVGTAHWVLSDTGLVERRREARQARIEAAVAERLRAKPYKR